MVVACSGTAMVYVVPSSKPLHLLLTLDYVCIHTVYNGYMCSLNIISRLLRYFYCARAQALTAKEKNVCKYLIRFVNKKKD